MEAIASCCYSSPIQCHDSISPPHSPIDVFAKEESEPQPILNSVTVGNVQELHSEGKSYLDVSTFMKDSDPRPSVNMVSVENAQELLSQGNSYLDVSAFVKKESEPKPSVNMVSVGNVLEVLSQGHSNLDVRSSQISPTMESRSCYSSSIPAMTQCQNSNSPQSPADVFVKDPLLSVKSVSVGSAQELLSQGHSYLDVRTVEEFTSGHVERAINIPFMLKTQEGRVKNEHFMEEVSRLFSKNCNIVVGCQSGVRSKMAAADLLKEGYENVIDLDGGYIDWLKNKTNDLN